MKWSHPIKVLFIHLSLVLNEGFNDGSLRVGACDHKRSVGVDVLAIYIQLTEIKQEIYSFLIAEHDCPVQRAVPNLA